jgi:enamine deaminase RidA (YjgF/YER057c/UK114 family)
MPSGRVQHLNPGGLHRNPAYSQVVVAEGNVRTVFVGGQNAVDASGEVVGRGDMGAQAEQVLRNLVTALEVAGATLENVVKWNVYVVQGQPLQPGFAAFQQAWGERPDPPAHHHALRRGTRPSGLPDGDGCDGHRSRRVEEIDTRPPAIRP